MHKVTSHKNSWEVATPSTSDAARAQRRVNAIVGESVLETCATTPTFGEVVIKVHASRDGCEITCSKRGVEDQRICFQIFPAEAPWFADRIMSQGCLPTENAKLLSKVLDEVSAAHKSAKIALHNAEFLGLNRSELMELGVMALVGPIAPDPTKGVPLADIKAALKSFVLFFQIENITNPRELERRGLNENDLIRLGAIARKLILGPGQAKAVTASELNVGLQDFGLSFDASTSLTKLESLGAIVRSGTYRSNSGEHFYILAGLRV